MTKQRVMTDITLIDKIKKLYPEVSGLTNYAIVNWSLNKNIKEAVA